METISQTISRILINRLKLIYWEADELDLPIMLSKNYK